MNIVAAEDTYSSDYRYTRKQSGLTVAINIPIVNAMQSVVDAAKTVGKSKNDRVNAMAAANTGWAAYSAGNAASELMSADNVTSAAAQSVSASITFGQSKSESTSHTEGSNAVASSVNAGGKVVIQATGAGENSNINIIGSDVAGKGGTFLVADNQVNIVAAKEYAQERSQNRSSGWNAGVAVSYGSNGFAFGVTAGGNKGKGVTIDADELNVVSLQDKSTYDSRQENISGSVTVGYGFSGSASYNKSKINSDYLSANELSGIYAGDDGFQINVNNNTNLVGAIITATEQG